MTVPRSFPKIAAQMSTSQRDKARALPSSKGGETPNQLQLYSTAIYSVFTIASPETQLLYSAENWVRLKITLETAGPVSVGTLQDIAPVLSGKGVLLDTTVPFEFTLAKGTRVYYAAENVNRMSVVVEPIPWLEQIDGDAVVSLSRVEAAVRAMGMAIIEAVNALGSKTTPPPTPGGRHLSELPKPPADRRLLPRATNPFPRR